MGIDFEIEKYLVDKSFILKTQQQIAKDFAKLNLLFPESFEDTFHSKETIELLISDQLLVILKDGESRLLQLLYMIDIPEKEFLALTGNSDFISKLASKVLFREAYKVFLREKFSS